MYGPRLCMNQNLITSLQSGLKVRATWWLCDAATWLDSATFPRISLGYASGSQDRFSLQTWKTEIVCGLYAFDTLSLICWLSLLSWGSSLSCNGFTLSLDLPPGLWVCLALWGRKPASPAFMEVGGNSNRHRFWLVPAGSLLHVPGSQHVFVLLWKLSFFPNVRHFKYQQ